MSTLPCRRMWISRGTPMSMGPSMQRRMHGRTWKRALQQTRTSSTGTALTTLLILATGPRRTSWPTWCWPAWPRLCSPPVPTSCIASSASRVVPSRSSPSPWRLWGLPSASCSSLAVRGLRPCACLPCEFHLLPGFYCWMLAQHPCCRVSGLSLVHRPCCCVVYIDGWWDCC